MNPLYNSKRQITDFYAKPSTEPVMTLDSSHDLGEYANPIYDFTSSPDERYANNTYTELTEVETCHIKILQHAMKNLLVSSVAKSPGILSILLSWKKLTENVSRGWKETMYDLIFFTDFRFQVIGYKFCHKYHKFSL